MGADLASPNPLAFTYYANDDLETVTHGNGVTTECTYFPEGPMETIRVESPTEQLLELTYAIDKVLNITGITEQHDSAGPNHAYTYGYNALDRLTSATYPTALGLPSSESFTYDDAGNREEPSDPNAYAYDANNRITSSPGKVWVYDADGNPASVNAGLSSEETFAYDAQNRMRGYTNTATTATGHYYDPSGRRIKRTVNGTTTWFVWDRGQVLAEFGGSGSRSRRYTYAGGLAPEEQVVPIGVSDEKVYKVHSDQLGAPRVLSEGTGSAVWRGSYRAFGTAVVEEDPDGDLELASIQIGFPGHFVDGTGLPFYNRYRTYEPSLGRYIEADPLGQTFGSNVYLYAAATPTSRIDPLGLFTISPRSLYDRWYWWGPVFWWHYVFDPRTVSLGELGLDDSFERASSVRSAVASFHGTVAEQVDSIAREACDGCRGSQEVGFSVASPSPSLRTDVTSEPGLFVVGNSDLLARGSCFVAVDCDRGTYTYECETQFGIADAFTDPFDPFDWVPGNWDPPGTTPYPIIHGFPRGTSGGGWLW